jgi:hypothetical protein
MRNQPCRSPCRHHGDALGARRIAHDHVFRGFALDHTRHLSQFRLDDKAVAVFRHDVARISELCLLTLALLGEFGLGVRGSAMRLVAALLGVKMALAVAPRRWRSAEPSFATKRFIDAQ